jgi:PAS domain S-box-containing protein
MDRTHDRSMFVAIGLIVTLLICAAALNYRNTQQLNEDAGWVAQTHEVIDLTSDVLLTLVDAETGERGYVISDGRDEFLQPYHAALAQLTERMAALKAKTETIPSLQAPIKALEDLTVSRLATLKESIELRRRGERRIRVFLPLVSKGKEEMDRIRMVIASMQAEEHEQLQKRQQQTRSTYQAALTTGLATAALGLIMVAAFGWLLDRNLRTRQKAAAVVQEQREWFRTTLSSIGDAVIATDIEGRVTFLNAVAEGLTGWKQNEAQGQPLETVFWIINESSRAPVENPALRALKDGQIVGLANHTVLIARDGTERPIDDSAAPICDSEGRIAGAVLTFHDITDRR